MARAAGQHAQLAFAGAIAGLLRESRRRQGLTQAQVAARTGGLVSKAALANYETGHRSLRIDIFWVIAKALGEDAGALLAGAERGSGYGMADEAAAPITVDVVSMQQSTDQRLAPVRRWFALRLQPSPSRLPIRTVTLDHGALSALAALMRVTPAECRLLLQSVSRVAPPEAGVPSPSADLSRRKGAAGAAVTAKSGPPSTRRNAPPSGTRSGGRPETTGELHERGVARSELDESPAAAAAAAAVG
jgi:transcriptional regulator with XRE-family HTH domain